VRLVELRHKFVDSVPEQLEPGVIYVSIRFATAAHLCPCGCGAEINTPFSPTDWVLMFDGVSVSLYPSIGNWTVPCQSHYWIQRDRVLWAGQMSKSKIDALQARERRLKAQYYGEVAGFSDAAEDGDDTGGFLARWRGWRRHRRDG
jgi:Family of unknown function (DUF6527)